MKTCPICKSKYPEDANFCPQETCATADGPQRLESVSEPPEPRFKPIERIGGSSTGEVWRARDGQTGTEIALKLVNPAALGSAATQARAEREFKQLMRVSSPRVATIIDCGKLPNERLFVAMELFPSESLASVLRSGPLDLETAKAMIGQVGQALLEAQKAGLVHRAVSPENVLVGPNGDVKVINFPLAAPVTDKVAGDPAYVSPEQAQGKPADQRSNTYSLAAILYHMLTGEPPFQAPTPQAVLDMHVSSPLLPPSQRRPGVGISAEADRLILKAMDKSSSRRHLTLRLFLTELEGVKAAAPGAAAAAAAKPAGSDVGLAKTMLFAGNQADVARMVAEATAAKAAAKAKAASASSEPATAPVEKVAAKPAPRAPVPSSEPTISVMETMAAEPAASVRPAPAAPSKPVAAAAPPRAATPAPKPVPAAQPAPAAQRSGTPALGGGVIKPAEAGKAPPPKAGAAFRETLWFKKGDVDQMVADAKAKLVAGGKPAADEAELPTDDVRPLEDRYVDDGSVTTEDRKKFSLRTGGTATALPAAAAAIPGEKMDERELVQEIGRGRRTAILVVAAVVAVALIVVVAMMMKGKKSHASQVAPPAAVTVSTPPPAAVPPVPAPAVPAVAPTAAPEKKSAAAGLGAADAAAKPAAAGAVPGAEQEAEAGKKPAKAPHRAKGGKKKR